MNWKKHYTTQTPLKVGDTVVIKRDLQLREGRGICINKDMLNYRGFITTITRVFTNPLSKFPIYNLEDVEYSWQETMFGPRNFLKV